MAFQEALSVKLLPDHTIINTESPERVEDVEAAVAGQISEAHRPGTSCSRSASQKFERLFHGCGKTLRQFRRKHVIQIGSSRYHRIW